MDKAILCKKCGENREETCFAPSELKRKSPRCKNCLRADAGRTGAPYEKQCNRCNIIVITDNYRIRYCDICRDIVQEETWRKSFAKNKHKRKDQIIERENKKTLEEKEISKLKNKERKKIKDKKYREKHKNELREKNKNWYEKNKEEIKKSSREKRLQNKLLNPPNPRNKKPKKEKVYDKEYFQNYYQENKKEIILGNIQREKERSKTDPIFKLRRRLSNSIRNMLKCFKSSKNNESILKYLEYSIEQLKQHIENQFEPWMNWNNQGMYKRNQWDDEDQTTWVWNIDHIIPHSDLPYDNMEHPNFKKCWSLENLRPLSAKQNILDGVRRIRHNSKKEIK
jgi:hypothetical protein